MATQFVPLNAKLIDEGEFLGDLDAELRELQEDVVKFARQHGEKAKGAKAKLTVEIELKVEDADDNTFSIKTAMKSTAPKRPASVSIALSDTDDDGTPALFVRKSGSDSDHPRQLKLATKDGRFINQDTGEPME